MTYSDELNEAKANIDAAKALADAEVASRNEEIEELNDEVDALEAEVTSQATEIEELEARIAELEANQPTPTPAVPANVVADGLGDGNDPGFKWDAVTGVTNYDVEHKVGSGTATVVRVATTSFRLTNVAAGTYSFRVRSVASDGTTVSEYSTAVTATVADAPAPLNPVEATLVTKGATSRAINGANIAFRGTDQIIIYTTAYGPNTGQNRYGVEVAVVNNVVTAVRDRMVGTDPGAMPIPANGYVLSGHDAGVGDTAGGWLRTNATVGSTLVLSKGTVVTPPVEEPTQPAGAAPQAYPAKAVSVYHMMWTNSNSPRLSTTPANVNVIRLAFAQGDPPSLVGPASEGSMGTLKTEIDKLRARGVRIIISIGGAGGHVNVANRQAFVNGIMNINNNVCTLDGLDWDLEGPAMGASDVVWICSELKRLRGDNFAITMAPNGSNIGHYISVAQALNNARTASNKPLLDAFGQQFYDAVVSQSAMMGRIDQYVAAGLPINKYEVGMMVGSADTYWTVDECIAHFNAAKSKYPTIKGAYLWEAGRAGTADWANRVGARIKA